MERLFLTSSLGATLSLIALGGFSGCFGGFVLLFDENSSSPARIVGVILLFVGAIVCLTTIEIMVNMAFS